MFFTGTTTHTTQSSLEELTRTLIESIAADQVFVFRNSTTDGLLDPLLALGSLSLQEKQAFWASQFDYLSGTLASYLDASPMIFPIEDIRSTASCPVLAKLRTQSLMIYPLKNHSHLLGMIVIGWLSATPLFTEAQAKLARILSRSMALEIDAARLYEQNHQQAQQAAIAQETTQAILRRDKLPEILKFIARECMRAMDALGCSIDLLENPEPLAPDTGEETIAPVPFDLADPNNIQLLEHKEPLIFHSGADSAPEEERSLLVIMPLLNDQKVVGILKVTQVEAYFQPKDITTASSFANQAAVAVELDRMYRRLEQTSAAEERARLARDLHDSISQSLYAMTLYTTAAQRQLTEGNMPSVEKYLKELNGTSREVLGEMRQLIFALRPMALKQYGLRRILEQRLQAVEARSGLEYCLNFELTGVIPAAIEENLYHITLEALNNIIKHAQANHVWISFTQDSATLFLSVRDDGSGFDPAAASNGGVGLKSIQERVECMQGQYLIQTKPGEGVILSIEVPYDENSHSHC